MGRRSLLVANVVEVLEHWAVDGRCEELSRVSGWTATPCGSTSLLADVKTAGTLAVVPVEAIPVRPVARAVWRAAPAAGLAAANVLLAVAHASGAAG